VRPAYYDRRPYGTQRVFGRNAAQFGIGERRPDAHREDRAAAASSSKSPIPLAGSELPYRARNRDPNSPSSLENLQIACIYYFVSLREGEGGLFEKYRSFCIGPERGRRTRVSGPAQFRDEKHMKFQRNNYILSKASSPDQERLL
jgi:hypothetical protein